MRKILLLLVSLLACHISYAEANRYPWGKTYMFRLYLSDKKGSPASLKQPEQFLSEKALKRRNRQHIRVDSTDLPLSTAYLKQIQMMGATIMSKSKWNNTVVVRTADSTMATAFGALPFVREVVHVWTAPDTLKVVTRDKVVSQMKESSRVKDRHYGNGGSQIGLLNGKGLHDKGYRGQGMTIAVLDGGFMNADRIKAIQDIKILGYKDCVVTPTPTIFAETDHGTQVLSCMGANVPEFLVGTAPEAQFWLIRAEEVATEMLVEEDYWAAAAEFADSVGVDLINSSLGYQDFDIKAQDHTYVQQDGYSTLISRTASMLAHKGIILCNSAGNDGMGQWKKINFPADAHNILAVGAINVSKNNAVFSSVGPSQDLRVKPDVMALGSPAATIGGDGEISWSMGTSFSSPIMCGMVACLWQALPTLTATEVMNLVRMSADNYTTPNNVFGYGLPDFMKAYEMGKNK